MTECDGNPHSVPITESNEPTLDAVRLPIKERWKIPIRLQGWLSTTRGYQNLLQKASNIQTHNSSN